MANNSITEATRLLLQTSANVYYRGLSEAAKNSVRANFFAADKLGEGKISFRDFLDSGSTAQLQDPARLGLFRFLDADDTGFLELDEFIMLHYIKESGTFYCNSCGIPIIIGGYSCTNCPSPPGRGSFDICLSCYASRLKNASLPPAFVHHHPQTSFVNLVANFQQSGASTMPSHTPFKSTMPSNNVTTREAVHIDEPGLIFTCDCCGANIVTDRYTCKECTVNSFDLCPSCYSSPRPYFRHHHPYSSFKRLKVQSQASAAAAEVTAAMAAMNANIAMNADMAAAAAMNANIAMNADMAAEVTAAMAAMNANISMNADMAAAAAMNAMNANMAAMSAAAMNANMATMGHLNQNLYPNCAQPAQGNNNNVKVGIEFLGKILDFTTQAGLFN